MTVGEIDTAGHDVRLNSGRVSTRVLVANRGDRPIQVGSHYHFYETNEALVFNRHLSRGCRLNIPAGTALRFEPGQSREVDLIPYEGLRRVFGFRGLVMGDLDA